MALDKTFRPSEVENRQYARWEDAKAFAAGANPNAKPYTIAIPPPNVTGSLHMGHALNNTLQDILIRFERMRGRDALWQPGTDHAGIATQMVVERQLAEQGKTRHDLGREKFIETVWDWKAESGGIITDQLRRMGASADWDRERFTMDEGLSKAVRTVFVKLHQEGLIYRDKRLVNWDPKLHTAISDLEVEQRETNGFMWNFKYPVEGSENTYITVATTRPETMLGDTAVAVHPSDERYTDLVGKFAILPLVGRRIEIITDEHADPEAGTGAVKITPAHDFNDFQVGRRHDLELVNIFDENAHLNDNAPEKYRGMDRFAARKVIVEDMSALGLVVSVDNHTLSVPHGDRSGVVIEPWLTDQWYVNAEKLAGPAIDAVESGRVKFVPKQWENTYFEWMRNIQPWCISRQIWWGHQIPAWYGPDNEIFVAMTEDEAQVAADAHYGEATELRRDSDVLDTWFSSALWPFSTLGWPDDTPEVKRYYPTDALVTGFDIIFFWVARMIMMGLHFMDEVPFHTVYIHALVRDEAGQKMSKSKGNVMDPLELVDEYGADALRFTLAAMAAQGRDIKMSTNRVEGYRNFATKLWNAARFCEMNDCVLDPSFDPTTVQSTVNRWIAGEVKKTATAVAAAIDAYKFNDAASALYKFAWGMFCDWHLEFIKPVLMGDNGAEKTEAQATAAWALGQILHLMHPFMPFLTEEIWERITGENADMLITSNWPELDGVKVDDQVSGDMAWTTELISKIRTVRSMLNVPAKAEIPIVLHGPSPESERRINAYWDEIKRFARLDGDEPLIETADTAPPDVAKASINHGEAEIFLLLAESIDVIQEKNRLEKERNKVAAEIAGIEKKLANKAFVDKAPDHVVATQHERKASAQATLNQLNEALARLG
ncbi:MAG: valine--tRNA ligase [Alphaproteobacteria bacterium]|nr:valine--tRNA ligase [Alphaproteobacteria bacterium]